MIKRLIFFIAVGVSVAVVLAPVGGASRAGLLSCPASMYPFAQFGDGNTYFGFANNGFESGATGWGLSRASVGSGNEPWYVNGSGDSSLSIAPGGTASSPRVCAALFAPHWRMFAHSLGANGSLRAQIVFYGLLGNVTGILNFTSFDPSDYGTWEPSGDIPSGLALPLATFSAQLRLTNTGSSGNWQVDDVFVDPWGSRSAA